MTGGSTDTIFQQRTKGLKKGVSLQETHRDSKGEQLENDNMFFCSPLFLDIPECSRERNCTFSQHVIHTESRSKMMYGSWFNEF